MLLTVLRDMPNIQTNLLYTGLTQISMGFVEHLLLQRLHGDVAGVCCITRHIAVVYIQITSSDMRDRERAMDAFSSVL